MVAGPGLSVCLPGGSSLGSGGLLINGRTVRGPFWAAQRASWRRRACWRLRLRSGLTTYPIAAQSTENLNLFATASPPFLNILPLDTCYIDAWLLRMEVGR